MTICQAITALCGFIFLGLHHAAETSVEEKLQQGRLQINSNTQPFCYGTGHSKSRESFSKKHFTEHLEDQLALVYPFCLTTMELGNRMGNYMNEVSCAQVLGVHFVTVHPQWDLANSFQDVNNTKHLRNNNEVATRTAFLKALPEVIAHPNPVDEATALAKIGEVCKCTRYCWQDKEAPWLKNIPNIHSIMSSAINAYYQSIDHTVGTSIDPATDMTNAAASEHLPMIPDVAIQYRCGDNIGGCVEIRRHQIRMNEAAIFATTRSPLLSSYSTLIPFFLQTCIGFSYMYGVLPFYAFKPRISPDAKYIYVLSDHPSRAPHSPYSSRCQVLVRAHGAANSIPNLMYHTLNLNPSYLYRRFVFVDHIEGTVRVSTIELPEGNHCRQAWRRLVSRLRPACFCKHDDMLRKQLLFLGVPR